MKKVVWIPPALRKDRTGPFWPGICSAQDKVTASVSSAYLILRRFRPEPMPISSSEALAHFFIETRDDLIRFLTRRLSCPETAADLAQETYLRLHSSEQKAKINNPRALAFHIAANLAVDHARKTRTRSRFEAEPCDALDPLEWAACPRPGPEHEVIARQTLARVKSALHELPEEKRTALYLSFAKGLTYAQIADCLGVSERMVAKRIAGALRYCYERGKEE